MVQVNDRVYIKGNDIKREDDINGFVDAIYPHHVIIKDDKGFSVCIMQCDIAHIQVIKPSNFATYDEKTFRKDIKDAVI